MHPNPIFRRDGLARHLAFARTRGFATIAVAEADRPVLGAAPIRLSEDGSSAELHLMRSNPVARACAQGARPATLVVSGPDGYISPDWYDLPDQVPTWNYVSVHLIGKLEVRPAAELRALLDRLSAHFEAGLAPKTPWTSDKMTPGVMERMMRALVPLRMEITDVEGTWKLNQNKPDAARVGAASNVGQGTGQELAALAALMQAVPPSD